MENLKNTSNGLWDFLHKLNTEYYKSYMLSNNDISSINSILEASEEIIESKNDIKNILNE